MCSDYALVSTHFAVGCDVGVCFVMWDWVTIAFMKVKPITDLKISQAKAYKKIHGLACGGSPYVTVEPINKP